MLISYLLKDNKINVQDIFKISLPSSYRKLLHLYPKLNDCQIELLELIYGLYIINRNELENNKFIFKTNHQEIWDEQNINSIKKLYSFLTYGKQLDLVVKNNETPRINKSQNLLNTNKFNISSEAKLCLFSGGMDSCSALIDCINKKNNVIPVHTLTNNRNLGLTKKIMKTPPLNNLKIIYTDLRQIYSNTSNDIGSLRGLLYLTNAFIISQIFEINEILFPENGPMMINPKTSYFLDPTRNAHPFIITEFEKIIKNINPKININCIFKDDTKTDVILKINKNEILNKTNSCFSTRQQGHCGLCYACLIRKYSAITATLEEDVNTYRKNIFTVNNMDSRRVKDFHQTIIFFLDLISNSYDVDGNISVQYIPTGFFKDYKILLRNFSIDILIGSYNDCKTIPHNKLNPLGHFLLDEMKKVDVDVIRKRSNELFH